MISTGLIKFTNKIFKKQPHPFNMQNEGGKTYAEWQYEKGELTIEYFTGVYGKDEMFRGKRVLDMGCGAAGKSLYYASLGAEHVTGVDIVEHYREESAALAEKLGLADKFTFVCASAFELPFPDGSFDTVIMNDFMEHVSEPGRALEEARRLLADKGRIFINFPPYFHPFGAHMSDEINMPWVHLFFTERQLIEAYCELVKDEPDARARIDLRFSRGPDGRYRYTYINKMTIKKFKKILRAGGFVPEYYSETPLRKFLGVPAKLPLLKEAFVKMVACVISKREGSNNG